MCKFVRNYDNNKTLHVTTRSYYITLLKLDLNEVIELKTLTYLLFLDPTSEKSSVSLDQLRSTLREASILSYL